MKHPWSAFILLAILFMLVNSAPLERGHGVLHRHSPHHRLSRRIHAHLTKKPLNLTFTPTYSGDIPVHVEYGYGTSTQLEMAGFRFSAALLKLGHDEAIAVSPPGRHGQVAAGSSDIGGNRHVVVSAPDPVIRAFQQRGVSQVDIPQYVRQNMQVADPRTGDQYQLVPVSNSEKPVSVDSTTVMIALSTS